jgi:hypothetical protein
MSNDSPEPSELEVTKGGILWGRYVLCEQLAHQITTKTLSTSCCAIALACTQSTWKQTSCSALSHSAYQFAWITDHCLYDRVYATKRQSMAEMSDTMSYVRVSILGTSPGGEVWSINPVFDPTGEFPGGVDQTALDAACDAIAALSPGTNNLAFMTTALAITGARVEVREDSNDALIGISQQVRPTPLAGSGSPLRGAQNALVVSLRTNTPGGSGRGRLYWPAVGVAVDSQLRFSTTFAGNLLSDMKTYLNAMRGALATAFPTIGFDLAVRSRTTHTTPHVNKLQVGTVPDTQRRRRDSMIEDYQATTFP